MRRERGHESQTSVFGLAGSARADAFLPLIRLLNQSIAQRRNGAEKLEQGIARGELREIKETHPEGVWP